MTSPKEARARIKINKLLEEAGWRFFDDEVGPANIRLEANVKITKEEVDALGEDFEARQDGHVDFLLLDEGGNPYVVLEAKRENKSPLDGKEQARRYAQCQNVRFVLLSNGNTHYFWDLDRGNPEIITQFPTQESLLHRQEIKINTQDLAGEEVAEDYIALSQSPDYKKDSRFQNEATREEYIKEQGLRLLRPYQIKAVHALQKSAKSGKDRFLFEMATGTGKTLVSAAVIKLFLRTGNAKRILFLVDRLELETQAHDNFVRYLQKDYQSVIYKQNRDDWKKAEIVISTIQSLASQSKYMKLFSPTDFELVISDEAHRSIGQNNRAVFEHFVGYKLGLTATPRDYLKNVNSQDLSQKNPREWERRQLLDTYKTFGCDKSEPTFKYSLLDGVRDGHLINPIAVDARTDITTELLSERGYAVLNENAEGEEVKETFFLKDFERKFFSEETNQVFCQTILEHALRDPLSNEIGKTLVFCVSQDHASKITQILNQLASQLWPDKYYSDFAVQVTSNIDQAQRMSNDFANNRLNGKTKFLPVYRSSKTRVCVTVGMMTTGYDCQDILNIALLRPVFSPTDFVQMKGRGTRKFTFEYRDENGETHRAEKENFKFLDFFANFEYFEDKFKYDEAVELPQIRSSGKGGERDDLSGIDEYESLTPDKIKQLTETPVGPEGMKVDRKLFQHASEVIQQDSDIKKAVEREQWEIAEQIVRNAYENKPELFLTLERLRKSEELDRRLTWREVLERIFGRIDVFKSREELLEEEANKFIAIHNPDSKEVASIKNFVRAYISDEELRKIIDAQEYQDLNNRPGFSMQEYRAVGEEWRNSIPEYIKDYVRLNLYMD